MDRWLIRRATVVTMDDERRVMPETDVLIDGSTIGGIASSNSNEYSVPPDHVIDANGMVAIPGLVNAHTHCAMTLLRGYADDMPLMPWLEERIWPFEMKLEEEDVYWGTLLGVAEMIRAGVTCFSDMYHFFEATARGAIDSGMRAVVSGVLLGFVEDAQGHLDRAIEFASEWKDKGDGILVTMLGPHAPYTVNDEFLEQVISAALDVKVGIHIHVSETKGEVEDSLKEHGITPVERLNRLGLFEAKPVLAAHCVHLTEDDVAILAGKGVGIAHCPGSNMKLSSGVAPIPKLIDAECVVGLGTDGPASNNNLDMIEEARLAALLHKLEGGDPTLVPAYQALEMATRSGARALGIEGEVGQIKPGMKADIVLFDFQQPHLVPPHDVISHLVYAARAGDVRTVFINGRLVMRDREFLTIDESEVYGQVRERLRRLT